MGSTGSKRFAFLTLLCAFWSVSLLAQSTTAGSVSGSVVDEQGAAIPGVTVNLRGPAMQGVRTVVTDGQGEYRFNNVPPGLGYDLTATLSGFQTQTQENFRVYLGREAHYDITLRAAVTEAITVTAAAPLVDVTRTSTGVNITTDQFENLPTARTFQQLTTLAPGVVMEMGDSRSAQLGNSPNVGASSAPENNYIIDGLSTTDARYGTSGTNLTMNFVEEVQVMTGGYSAEYGRSTGGVFNVITKSGGNEFHGDVYAYISEASWGADRANRFSKGSTSQADISDSQDIGVSLGGPIMKDRLWFFGAYNPSRRTIDVGATTDEDGELIGDAATEFDQDSDFYAGKLTFAANPNHNFVLTAFGDPTTLEGWLLRGIGAPPAEEGAAVRKNEIGSDNINFRYTGIITSAWLVEGSIGQHKKDYILSPATEIGRTVPRQIDEVNALFQRGGFQRFQDDEATRDAYALKFSNFLGQHELRYGVDVEINKYSANLDETWYRHFGEGPNTRFVNECAGRDDCVFIEERIYTVAGEGQTDNEAAFLQDQWRVLPNLQLNLGVRYEQQTMSSARGVFLGDSFDDVNNGEYEAAPEYKFDDNWAPRLGIVWDPLNNGRSKIYAFGGRFYEAIPLDLNIRALNGEDYIINSYQHVMNPANPDFWFNPSGNPIPANVRAGGVGAVTENGWAKFRERFLTAATLTPLDADLKLQYQDEYILGGEYQFGSVWSTGLRLVNRELKRVVEDFGTFTDPDPSVLTGYVIGNPGEGTFGAPYDKPKRQYQAAELTLQRAYANNWQLYASYVYAKAEGNHEGLFMTGYEQLDPNITALYDIPSFLANGEGRLRADRPYVFKVHSSYTFPFGLTVGEGFFFSAGAPYSAQGPEIYNGYGDGTIFFKERGSEGRTPDYWSLDLHMDYMLPFLKTGGGGLSVILDVLNVFDNDETVEVDQDYIYQAIVADQGAQFAPWFDESNLDAFGNPGFRADLPRSSYFGTPILLQSPRTVQVGVKFTY